ncbi:MAG: 3-hydroxyacyl-CoA dehydrogenase [Spirochaetes bacterium]|nr:3-hydroxyacyl-CoA dehydrogenase [Spirochaetota bacterium]
MDATNIKTVLIIGSGTMGQQIGFLCALHGCSVHMYDISDEILNNAQRRLERLAQWFENNNVTTAKDALSKIHYFTEPKQAAKDVDFVSESVPEDPKLKAKVFAIFNTLCPEHAIFTTNTSSLIPSQIAQETGRPEKFLAFHFHDVRMTKIVDIMPHPGTSEEATQVTIAFAKRLNQIPIVLKKENYGYVFNTMLMTLISSALTLAANEVANIRDIDRSFMGVMHTAIGPFGIMDSIGLDTVYKVTKYWADLLNDAQGKKNADFLKTYIDKGLLGTKTGEGFYKYPHPDFSKPEFLE